MEESALLPIACPRRFGVWRQSVATDGSSCAGGEVADGVVAGRDLRVAHGVFEAAAADGGTRTGVVLSDGALLTAVEVGQMEVVPEVVFLNCCHLARMDPTPVAPDRLAYSLARELIGMGARCVVAGGWAGNDEPAWTFARWSQRSWWRTSSGCGRRRARRRRPTSRPMTRSTASPAPETMTIAMASRSRTKRGGDRVRIPGRAALRGARSGECLAPGAGHLIGARSGPGDGVPPHREGLRLRAPGPCGVRGRRAVWRSTGTPGGRPGRWRATFSPTTRRLAYPGPLAACGSCLMSGASPWPDARAVAAAARLSAAQSAARAVLLAGLMVRPSSACPRHAGRRRARRATRWPAVRGRVRSGRAHPAPGSK